MSDSTKTTTASDARDALPPASTSDPLTGPRAELAKVIPRRPRVSWWLGIVLAVACGLAVTPIITAERWLGVLAKVERGVAAPFTVRVAPFAGHDTASGHVGGGGVLVARGEVPDRDTVEIARQIDATLPHGAVPAIAYLLLACVLAALFTHHTRRSTRGRLLRVQLVSLAVIVGAAVAVKALMLATALSVLVVPVALFAMLPTLVLDRVVGLATGTLAALVVSLLVPFDVGAAVMLMVQAGAAGFVIAERPKKLLRPVLMAGAAATLFTALTYPLMLYLTAGRLPLDELSDPLHSAWLASTLGPAVATALVIPLVPPYQLLVGEITQGKLVELEDMSNPLLQQIANKAPGTWQHSLMMANMAEIAANTIGANGRLVRVGAYYHDLGKSLQPKYFIENLEPGETSPHDKLPPDVSCDAIFAHVTEGIVSARKAGLHERVIDFMHMHHGNGVLEYFWGKTREQGNPKGLSVEHFRYPGVPPQSRETAILSICDAVEAASRTLKKPEVSAIDNLVQRIVYGKLHLGQLDDSGLSMGDLRRIAESLRETIRHANHGRIEYPWQKAQQDASASANQDKLTQTGPRLDSLDRPARPDTMQAPSKHESADALAVTEDAGATPKLRPTAQDPSELATKTTAPVARPAAAPRDPAPAETDDVVELRDSKPQDSDPRMLRATHPVGERRPSAEAIQFANEAKSALAEASKDLAARSRPPEDTAPDVPAARTRAATLPPMKSPTIPPPIPRAASIPPPVPRPPAPNLTAPPPDALRPPATPSSPPQLTAPPPGTVRPPAPNASAIDDMITLQPQYELRPPARPDPTPGQMIVKLADDGTVTVEPITPAASPATTEQPAAPASDDAMITQPRMFVSDGAKTTPEIKVPEGDGESSWARGLAARLDAQLEHDFGTETPVSAPTRAELQALLDQPPDVTRQQSIDELEALHEKARERLSEPGLDLTRRASYPTAEVDDADIEAAIELAPPARRNALGVAKKPKD